MERGGSWTLEWVDSWSEELELDKGIGRVVEEDGRVEVEGMAIDKWACL